MIDLLTFPTKAISRKREILDVSRDSQKFVVWCKREVEDLDPYFVSPERL